MSVPEFGFILVAIPALPVLAPKTVVPIPLLLILLPTPTSPGVPTQEINALKIAILVNKTPLEKIQVIFVTVSMSAPAVVKKPFGNATLKT